MKIPLFAKLMLAALIVGTGAVLSSGWKEMERSKRIEAEVDSLRQEADRIRGENRTIEEKIAFFSTEPFEEREAKEKLGMKKRDEEAVVLDTGSVLGAESSGSESAAANDFRVGAETPNYRKWAVYFGIKK
jgi:cell division protein FtsB